MPLHLPFIPGTKQKIKTLLLLAYLYSCHLKHSFIKYLCGAAKHRQDTVSCLQDRYNLPGNKEKYMQPITKTVPSVETEKCQSATQPGRRKQLSWPGGVSGRLKERGEQGDASTEAYVMWEKPVSGLAQNFTGFLNKLPKFERCS